MQQFMNQGGRGGRNMGPFANMRNGGIGTQKTDENGVAIVNQGLTVAQGTIEELTRDSHRYEVDAAGGPASVA